MAAGKKQAEPEQEPGAPEWMVTFSDCMTLLLTFFVLLLSFSSFDDKDHFRKMSSSIAYQFSFDKKDTIEQDSVSDVVPPIQKMHWSSEKPTLDNEKQEGFKRKTEPADFLRLNTFLISSDEVFWGTGSTLSSNGRKVLTDLSLFLKELPDYSAIISESGPQNTPEMQNMAFDRVWAIYEYLKDEQGITQQQLSISSAGTAVKEYHLNSSRKGNAASNDRMLEIVLLKRSI